MKYLYTIICISCYSLVFGQTKDLPNSFTYKVIGIDTYSPYLEQLFSFDEQTFGFSAVYNRYLNESLSLSLPFRFGQMNYPYDVQDFYEGWTFYAQDVAIKYNFFTANDKKVRPYISGGLGFMYIQQAEENWETQIPIELGISYELEKGLFLQLSTSYRLSNGADAWHNGIGLQFNFDTKGKETETVSTRSLSSTDLTTSSSQSMDDYDFYIDILDDHRTSKMEVSDSDNDGIPDVYDLCPDVAGDEMLEGCPIADDDMDGLANHEDKCPNIAGMLEFAGCPDTDNDRIPDALDECPKEAGTKSCNGCPDFDGDNVADYLDKCPTEKGEFNNEGCPSVDFGDTELKGILEPVVFDKFNYDLDSTDISNLNYIIQVLENRSDAVLNISGIAFDSNNKEINDYISTQRAKACFDYLIEKGVDENRLIYQGLSNKRQVPEKLQQSVDFQILIR